MEVLKNRIRFFLTHSQDFFYIIVPDFELSHCAVIYLKQHILGGLKDIYFRAGTPPYSQIVLMNYIWHWILWNSSLEINQISQELPTKSVLNSRYQEEVAGG